MSQEHFIISINCLVWFLGLLFCATFYLLCLQSRAWKVDQVRWWSCEGNIQLTWKFYSYISLSVSMFRLRLIWTGYWPLGWCYFCVWRRTFTASGSVFWREVVFVGHIHWSTHKPGDFVWVLRVNLKESGLQKETSYRKKERKTYFTQAINEEVALQDSGLGDITSIGFNTG